MKEIVRLDSAQYFPQKNFSTPRKIDISAATLTYEIENLHKNQFEILSEGRTTSLQASSSEAMMYWLDTLQKKRRKFSARRQHSRSCKDSEVDQVSCYK